MVNKDVVSPLCIVVRAEAVMLNFFYQICYSIVLKISSYYAGTLSPLHTCVYLSAILTM